MNSRVDTGFWIAVLISVVFHFGGAIVYYRMAQGSSGGGAKVPVITAAVLVRKGVPRDKSLLPRIFKDRPRTVPQRRVVERVKPPTRRRRVISDEELMKRAQQKIEQLRSKSRQEEDDPRAEYGPKPGQKDGHDEGTEEQARIGNIYLGKLRSKIENNLEFPEILSKTQIQQCRQRIQVMMYLRQEGTLEQQRLRIIRSGGDHRCDNAVLAAIKRASPFVAPPSNLWQAVKQGIIIQLAE